MLFKVNALMRRDYKDDYSPYSFSFDMGQDISQYPDIVGNISHGMYFAFNAFISMLKKIAEVKDMRDEDEYEYDSYGLPLHFKSFSVEIEDGIEKLGLYYLNESHTTLTLLCNDQATRIRYDLIVESDDKSAQIHCGVMARIKCPNICEYLANQLVIFMMPDRNVQTSSKQGEYMDALYDDDTSIEWLKERYSTGLSIVLSMNKKYDVILINCRKSGNVEDDSTFEWLEDKLDEFKNTYGFANRFVNLNFIYDDDFSRSCKYNQEGSPMARTQMIEKLKELHDMIVNSDSDDPETISGGVTAIPLEEGDTPDDVRAKIKEALDAKGFGKILDSDTIVDKIMEARENQSTGGVYFGSISAGPDGEISRPNGISLSAENINYFINELHNTDRPHALIKATLNKIRENPGLKDVSDELLISILKEAIIEYADPEIMSNLDNFKPDKEDE